MSDLVFKTHYYHTVGDEYSVDFVVRFGFLSYALASIDSENTWSIWECKGSWKELFGGLTYDVAYRSLKNHLEGTKVV